MLLDATHLRALLALRRGRRRARRRPARRAGASRADAEHARGRIGRVPRRRRAAQRSRDRAARHHGGHRAARPAARRRGRAPVLALRGSAHHDARPLPLARRAAAVRRAPRARVRHARARRGARPGSRDARDGEPARGAARAAGALGELAVLARRGDRARLHAHRDLREHAALGPAAALLLLRGLPRDGRHDGGSRRDRRLHVPVVGRAPASAPRHGRDPRHGRAVRPRPDADAGRVRAGERGAGDRRGPARPAADRPITASSSPRTSGLPRATASTRC